jgi:hypothetical protein
MAAAIESTPANWGDWAEESPAAVFEDEVRAPAPKTPAPAPKKKARSPPPHKGKKGGDVERAVAVAAATVKVAAAIKKPAGRGFALLAEDDEEETPEEKPEEVKAPVMGVGAGAGAGAGGGAAAATEEEGWTTARGEPVPAPKPAPIVKMPVAMSEEEEQALERNYSMCLRVANLPMDITEEKLEAIFENHYGVTNITLPRKAGKPRGFAFIEFKSPDDTSDCLCALQGNLKISGRRVRGQSDDILVEYAKSNVAPGKKFA